MNSTRVDTIGDCMEELVAEAIAPLIVRVEALEKRKAIYDAAVVTLDRILAVVAEHGDADLRHQVDAIVASGTTRVEFADMDFGEAVN